MTPLSSQDLEALKALAEKATPGEWRWMQREDHAVKLLSTVKAITGENDIVMVRLEGVRPSDRAFIAAFNPQTALALLSHIAALEAEKAEARNTATLLRAEADGLGSMLLDVQQDCITAVQRAETAEAKEYAMSFEYFAAIGKALLDGAMDDCFAAYQVDVAELREGKKTWTGEQTAHVIDRMLAVMIGMNNRLDIVQAEARRLALEEAQQCSRGCQYDLGFDREMGPLGCKLEDGCVCCGITMAIEALKERP